MQINQETFEAWLLARDPEETFNYFNNYDCLFCRFLKTRTSQYVAVGGQTFDVGRSFHNNLPNFVQDVLSRGKLLTRLAGNDDVCKLRMREFQLAYLELYPQTFAITDGTSREDCILPTGDVETPAHNCETHPQTIV